MSSSTTRLYRGQVLRLNSDNLLLPHTRQSWETMTSVSAGHIILTPTQSVGRGRPQRESNPAPRHQESCALPNKLPPPTPERELNVLQTLSESPRHVITVTLSFPEKLGTSLFPLTISVPALPFGIMQIIILELPLSSDLPQPFLSHPNLKSGHISIS